MVFIYKNKNQTDRILLSLPEKIPSAGNHRQRICSTVDYSFTEKSHCKSHFHQFHTYKKSGQICSAPVLTGTQQQAFALGNAPAGRRPVKIPAAGFDFHKNKGSAVKGNYIDFAAAHLHITVDDPVTFAFEQTGSYPFTAPADTFTSFYCCCDLSAAD